MKSGLPTYGQQATVATRTLVDCKGCIRCCEHGLVYVVDDERERLINLGVPLVSASGVSFIQRRSDGSCPMLDREGKRCTIYEDRPLCCRLFPLDLFAFEGELGWAVADKCPEDRKFFEASGASHFRLGGRAIREIAAALDGRMDDDLREFFRRKERAAARVEVIEVEDDGWTPLAVGAVSRETRAVAMAREEKKRESKKELLKRKLKEKQRGKKDAERKKRRRRQALSRRGVAAISDELRLKEHQAHSQRVPRGYQQDESSSLTS